MPQMTKKAVVAVGRDGMLVGRWESMYELCQASGKDCRWFKVSCNTGRLYLGLRWMWVEDYEREHGEGTARVAVAQPQTQSEGKTELEGIIAAGRIGRRQWRRSVAFSYDLRGRDDNQLMFLFKGATASLLRRVFDPFVESGVMTGYSLRETHDVARLWRHQYWRLEIWPEGYDSRMAGLRDMVGLIDRRLRSMVMGEVDFYLIDDWLNLTDRRPKAVSAAWQSLGVQTAVPPQKSAKRRRRKDAKPADAQQDNTNKPKDMPRIYLRVPGLVAGFYRGMNRDKQPDNFEPYEFPDHDDLLYFMEKQLNFIPEQNQSVFCLSERAFNNILHGRAPGGGKQIINRRPDTWPDMKEVCALTGKFVTDKNESADYLCIGIPKEVLVDGELRRTNGSYCLSKRMADTLIAYMRRRFKRELEAFMSEDIENCIRRHVKRSDVERMDRFMTVYNMPISIDDRERESLRKIIHRIKRLKKLPPFLDEDLDEFVYHISEDDLAKTERWDQKQERLSRKASKTNVK